MARLEAAGAGGPAAALEEAARAARAAGAGPAGGARLRADLAGATRFRAALERHCALAEAPRLPHAGEADRARLAALLSSPAYRDARADAGALRRLLLDAWARLVDRLGSAEAGRWAGFGRAVFLSAAAVAAALGVAALLRRRRPAAARAREAAPATGRALVPPPEARLSEAEAALARGDAREAVRRAFLAALAALERDGAVPRGRTFTNRELVAQAAGRPGLSGLAPLAALFDRIVYGGRAAAPGEAREALGLARALARGGAGSGAEGGP